jgi:DUF438 domain-containing protein
MIYKEEHILYPASLDMLTDPEWIKVKEGEADIGFAWVVPNTGWPENLIQEPEDIPAEPEDVLEEIAGALGLDTGRLTLQQINLMLTHLPVDLTFVDENDRVAYYSEGPERIFPRSPAIARSATAIRPKASISSTRSWTPSSPAQETRPNSGSNWAVNSSTFAILQCAMPTVTTADASRSART